ncbi:DUF4192 domain-containing protein [Allokutzneria sp. A3M-2-11 16]|uniref:DUF4192 domain-containing protein n=1 Tax=Allokutzneria sp. A3M-2-11 16 TaxID=2962043 RepID=UPI0020B86A69|nr:DUF4192 domain-containing protein [Allokutzneria sp. A3M-2-11 16]MCP3800713.1 DUF4192 domain-containing protein [Allokutzneria sp. A3M-2-11 16]
MSTNTSTGDAPVRLSAVGDLVASIPPLLGFHPTDSVVILVVDADSDRLTRALRADLPELVDDMRPLAERLTETIGPTDRALVIMICDGTATDTSLPRESEMDVLSEVFTTAGILIIASLWARSTLHRAPCRRYGNPAECFAVADSDSSVLAAESTLRGRVVHASAKAAARSLNPVEPPEVLAEREKRLSAATDELRQHLSSSTLVREINSTLTEAITAAENGNPPEADSLITIVAALDIGIVRDTAAQLALGDTAHGARVLWEHLTRTIPGPLRAHPAALLALSAYLKGDGPLARVALDIALNTNPNTTLAVLLRHALDNGIHPTTIAKALAATTEPSHA